ncbi:TPA: putative holin [Serratia marcescens]|uniref:putative holin n=1 Tax=Serratia marcescens TaxID=615 RepID=UPI001C76E156|nr:putative holin [Serratia marcescens]BCZ41309.1 membrane protein [Serratia marcescens]HBI6269921.1 putative holin [Serratia marcescens]HBI6952381.1 putative holin [Serratia marcescens]HBI6960468.1 putative holin [Serratia marcescens]
MSLLKNLRHQRLRNWIILAVVLLLAIAIVSPMQLGVTLYKLSLVSIAAILGYHLDRALFPYASPGSYLIDDWKNALGKPPIPSGRNEPEFPVATGYELVFAAVLLRRALIVSAICIGVTMGL